MVIKRMLGVLLLLGGLAAPASTAIAQEQVSRVIPTNHAVLTGYGTVGYQIQVTGENTNSFSTSVAPIFLWQFQDRILFEAELEFEVQEGVTETGLEYASIDVILTDNITAVGGKFLVPFGVFGDRLHPSWINKFPSSPPIYGHHVAGFGTEPLMPILSDIGVMGRGVIAAGVWNIGLNGYITQGAVGEVTGPEPAELEFPGSTGDNNTNKMMGGRLDIALPPWFEINFSGLTGKYDANDVLDFTAWNVALEARVANFELRGEYMQTRQEFETIGGFPLKVRNGLYAQLSYRWNAFEPVLRWTQAFNSAIDGSTDVDGAQQAGFSLSYWLTPSVALMAAYELNRENGTEIDNDRVLAHLAFGF